MSNESLVQELLTYRAELFGFIRALLRNTHDAEDLFQEVSAVVLREASASGEPIRDFRAWVKEVARRKALEHYRARRACRAAGLPVEEMAGWSPTYTARTTRPPSTWPRSTTRCARACSRCRSTCCASSACVIWGTRSTGPSPAPSSAARRPSGGCWPGRVYP